jgi:hypothetical protein
VIRIDGATSSSRRRRLVEGVWRDLIGVLLVRGGGREAPG